MQLRDLAGADEGRPKLLHGKIELGRASADFRA